MCGFHQKYSIISFYKQGSKHRIGVSCSKPEHKAQPRYRTQIPKFQGVPSPLPISEFLNSFLSPAHFEPHKVPVLPWRSAPTWHFSPPPLTNHFLIAFGDWNKKHFYIWKCVFLHPLCSTRALSVTQLIRPWHAICFCAPSTLLPILNVKKCSQKTTSKFNLNWTKGRHKISKWQALLKLCKCTTILKPSSSLSRAGQVTVCQLCKAVPHTSSCHFSLRIRPDSTLTHLSIHPHLGDF